MFERVLHSKLSSNRLLSPPISRFFASSSLRLSSSPLLSSCTSLHLAHSPHAFAALSSPPHLHPLTFTSSVAVEKWDFCIECDRDFSIDHEIEADQEEIQKGIRSVIRQIIATISVLPFLDGCFTFDMLMYTDKNTALPSNKWEDAKPQYVGSGEQLKFPTVATGIHNVGTMVSYKVD